MSYLFYENVPKRIFNYNSQAKIIIMLRQPIERAFSHYLMDCRLGFCSEKLEDIIADPQSYPQYFQQYLELGNYYSQLKGIKISLEKNSYWLFFMKISRLIRKSYESVFSFLQ